MLAWDQAPRAILAGVDALSRAGRSRVVVGITGPVGAGKTTLALSLGGTVISTDWYLPDYETVEYSRRDLPEVADLAALAQDLASLRSHGRAEVPVWSFATHRREGRAEVTAPGLIVVEGIHALHDRALPHLDLRVFVDAPDTVRWTRWEALEASGQRGWGVAAAREYFDRVAEPTYRSRESLYRSRADFIVLNHSESGPAPADSR